MPESRVDQPLLVSWRDRFTVIAAQELMIRRTGEPVVRLTLHCRGTQTVAYLRHAQSRKYGRPSLGHIIFADLRMHSFPKPGRLIVDSYESMT